MVCSATLKDGCRCCCWLFCFVFVFSNLSERKKINERKHRRFRWRIRMKGREKNLRHDPIFPILIFGTCTGSWTRKHQEEEWKLCHWLWNSLSGDCFGMIRLFLSGVGGGGVDAAVCCCTIIQTLMPCLPCFPWLSRGRHLLDFWWKLCRFHSLNRRRQQRLLNVFLKNLRAVWLLHLRCSHTKQLKYYEILQ